MLIKPADTQPFAQGYSEPLPTACYAFSKTEKTLVAAAVSRPDETSFALGRQGRGGGIELEALLLVVSVVVTAAAVFEAM